MRQTETLKVVAALILCWILTCAITSCTLVRQRYEKAQIAARERQLQTALSQIREVINQYTIILGALP
jgi:hypothetical protein